MTYNLHPVDYFNITKDWDKVVYLEKSIFF